jgi:ribonuclease HII
MLAAIMGLFRAIPTLSEEIRAWRAGHRLVAGVDEVGRGPIAGPVVASAVILDPERAREWWSDLRDSKQLPAKERERLAALIMDECAWAIGVAGHDEVDAAGVVEATRRAMLRALAALPEAPSFVVADAITLPEVDLPQRALTHGDALSASVAAASIVAKVRRDALMREKHEMWPRYAFDRNKGYGTADHLRALAEHGVCPIHRRTFAPVAARLEGAWG